MRIILLERIEEFEIWRILGGRAERFVVRLSAGHVRLVGSLHQAATW